MGHMKERTMTDETQAWVFKAVVVTVSDSAAAGEREDLSGPKVKEILTEVGIGVDDVIIIPDELRQIRETIARLCDEEDDIDLVVTTGGTGFGPRDVTPEATLSIIERQANSLVELMRSKSYGHGPEAALSRGIAGIRGSTLILNLPGSPSGAAENLDALLPILRHALQLVKGGQPH